MDDPDCDSTWEEEENEEDGCAPGVGGDGDGAPGDTDDEAEEGAREARPRAPQSRVMGSRNWRAVRDTCRYRHHYPDLVERDGNGDMPNLSFYKNEIRFLPNGCFIEDILQNWKDDYDLLEDNHSYIQWLFPLREPGVNWHAKPLTLREVEAFKSSEEIRKRLIQAYKLMLGFYGIQLKNEDTGQVCRAQNYLKRFQNLDWHSHNNLRITRILKSLGELGLEHYQAPLARFFLEETLVHGELQSVRQSALDYFVFTVRCRRQRRQLLRFAWEHFQPRSKFVWGPHDKLQQLQLDPPAKADELEWTCSSGRDEGGDRVPPDTPPLEEGALERDQHEEEDEACTEEGLEPSSPKESKKRKLEVNRPQTPRDPGLQGVSEVEKIALNLKGCALSQGSLQVGTQDVGNQEPGEAEEPCLQPHGAKVTNELRKRRKVDQGTAGAGGDPTVELPASPKEDENGIEEVAGQGSPATAEPVVDESTESSEARPLTLAELKKP
ncbi:opioid growth factor receptor isoform X2 [Erinaceus europaeus]|uniref:Opioid growth factor receptor isoform X2 n=1 Tax=Erinaceus europaeus TaxID=9365 RepID=A0A1S2ZJS8_ERIEU|nr:opioid growth factor receptor isoform X2 [Erinaceus europaeus]